VTDTTRVAIVGLGAIGGSVALALLEHGMLPTGYASSADDRHLAREAGVRVVETLDAAVRDAEIVLISTPLDVLAGVAEQVVGHAPEHATLLHAASLQRPEAIRFSPATYERVFGTHPYAGTHASGFAAAHATLFRDGTVYVEDRVSARDLRRAEWLWATVGARRIVRLFAFDHDNLMGRISHTPQLLATALARTFAVQGISSADLGPGARDMTRLAGSSLDMWAPLLENTPASTLESLARLENLLGDLRRALETKNMDFVNQIWHVARLSGPNPAVTPSAAEGSVPSAPSADRV
jgi:prephenate dehydrogenase